MNRFTTLTTLVVLLCGGFASQAEDCILLTASTTRLPLTPWLSTYRDVSGAATLEQAQQAFRDGHFQASRKPWPSFGFTPNAVWVRFAVRSETAGQLLWLTELRTARMSELDWYLIRRDGRVEHLVAGNLRECSPEMVDNKFPIFPMWLAAGETAEVFLRVRSEAALHLPLQIWEPKAFIEAQAGNEAAFAAFFGYLAALILLSLVLSLFIRDRGFVIYSLSLLGIFGLYFIFSGYYVWLRLPGGRFAVLGGVILGIEYTLLLMMAYLRYFFDLPASMPGLNRWIVRLAWGIPPITVVFLLGPYRIMDQLAILQVLLFGVGSQAVSLVAWWRGNRVVRFYALAWLSFWSLLSAHGIDFELSVSGDSDQPGPGLFPGMSLFRVFKESVTNAVKHSSARRVAALMEFTPSRFRLTVWDNGRGMGAAPGSGRGLANMAARIQELGGTMTCRSEQGTQLVFELPLPLKTPADSETAQASDSAPI